LALGNLTVAGGVNGPGHTCFLEGPLTEAFGDCVIGAQGTGRFIQTGGVHRIAATDLVLGGDSGFGTYVLDNTASLSVSSDVLVGSGFGTFQQLGGAARVARMQLGYAGGRGILNISGGTLTTLLDVNLGPAGEFQLGETAGGVGIGTQTGGSLACNLLSIANGASVASTGSYTLSGGTLDASTTRVGSSQSFGQVGNV
jgi:hypothetical protein